jgi:WD40 repeat protein
MIEHRSPISGIDTTGERYVATAGYDNQLILWDALTSQRVGLNRACHDHLVNQCRFSPSGDYLVSASSDYTARIWTVPELRLVAVLSGHDDDVEMASFSSKGDRVATASRDYCVRIFDAAGKRQLTLEGHTADVLSVEWSADGSQLVTCGDDGTLRRWDAERGQLTHTIDLGGIETDTLAVGANGEIIVGNDSGQLIRIGNGDPVPIEAHSAGIKRLVVSRDRRILVSTSYDRSIKLWSLLEQGGLEPLMTADAPAPVWLRSAALLNRNQLVCGTFGSSYAIYNITPGSWCLDEVADTPGLNTVCTVGPAIYTIGDAGIVRRDGDDAGRPGSLCNFLVQLGERVLTGGQLGEIYDADTGALLHHHYSPLNCGVSFSRRGERHVMIGSYTGEGLVFRESRVPGERPGIELVETVRLDANAIKGLASDGDTVFAVTATGSAVWVTLDTLTRVHYLADAHDRIANGAACLRPGVFVSVSRDRNLRIWSNRKCQRIATPHRRSVKCVATCEKSGLIATGSYDGEVGIFDMRNKSWNTHRPSVFGISSISSGLRSETFLASSYDGCVYEVEREKWRLLSAT